MGRLLHFPFSIIHSQLTCINYRFLYILIFGGETMETITFTADLERNIRMMQELFRNDDTLIIRRAIGQNGLRCALFSLTAW